MTLLIMIPLEKQVCSLDLAKRLKELGVRQESLFIWNYYPHTDGYKLQYNPDYGSVLNISAFTVAELGEMLPQHIKYDDKEAYLYIWRNGDKTLWCVAYFDFERKQVGHLLETAPTEADARAKMLIYLVESGFITL